jgi:DNA-binding XRE family transcriptional regulator
MKRWTSDEKQRFFERLHQDLAERRHDLASLTKTLRQDFLGVDQPTFARLSKVSLRTLKAIEAGQGNPTLKTLNNLLRPFALEMWVVARVTVPPPPKVRDPGL